MDVFPRTGLMRNDHVADVLKVIDDCRIRWGRVVTVEGDWLVVSVVPIRLVDGKLALVEAQIERVQAWRDGTGFIDHVEPGDTVSIHWNWACERLDSRRLANLMGWTQAPARDRQPHRLRSRHRGKVSDGPLDGDFRDCPAAAAAAMVGTPEDRRDGRSRPGGRNDGRQDRDSPGDLGLHRARASGAGPRHRADP